MAKYNAQKGDKIYGRTPSAYDECSGRSIGGHIPISKPLTVTKSFNSGVRTKEIGFVHNNNILGIAERNVTND